MHPQPLLTRFADQGVAMSGVARYEAALRLAGFDWFALDRLAVDGVEPLPSEVARLRGVLNRLATLFRCRK